MKVDVVVRGDVETSVRTSAVWESVRAVVLERGTTNSVVSLRGPRSWRGTGGLAVPLAQLGHHVTVIEPAGRAGLAVPPSG